MNKQRFKKQIMKGFTLVELLIVVIILAILAAIVVPQFASSTDDAKSSALDANLASLRSALDLYYQQHGHYPSAVAAVPTSCSGAGTASTGAIDTSAAFIDQLAFYTNSKGEACSTQGVIATPATYYPYGPYLKKRELPKNPLTDNAAVALVQTGDMLLTGAAAPGAGWKFDSKSGKFIADHVDYDDR